MPQAEWMPFRIDDEGQGHRAFHNSMFFYDCIAEMVSVMRPFQTQCDVGWLSAQCGPHAHKHQRLICDNIVFGGLRSIRLPLMATNWIVFFLVFCLIETFFVAVALRTIEALRRKWWCLYLLLYSYVIITMASVSTSQMRKNNRSKWSRLRRTLHASTESTTVNALFIARTCVSFIARINGSNWMCVCVVWTRDFRIIKQQTKRWLVANACEINQSFYQI